MQSSCTLRGLTAAFFWLFLLHIPNFGFCSPTSEISGTDSGGKTEWIDLASKADSLNLHSDPTWHALLHLKNSRPQINDESFLLSAKDFSPKSELHETLKALYGPSGNTAVCRFPARQLWLGQKLNLPLRSTKHCQAFEEFKRLAPADRISLVFASESISEPSSTMGHLILRLDGIREDGTSATHAVSFFTDANTLNLPKLFYESMVKGKNGYFSLNPYHETVAQYALNEQRHLWEYPLNLNDFTRALFQSHAQELRQARITYFFQNYNCATLVLHMLAVAQPSMLEGSHMWTTPKDVLRQAHKIGLIEHATVQTPARWQVRSLAASMPRPVVRQVLEAVGQQDASSKLPSPDMDERTGFLSIMLAQSVLRYQALLAQSEPPESRSERVNVRIAELDRLQEIQRRRYPHLQLSADTRRDPALSPAERQLSVGWVRRDQRDMLNVRFLPASHTLSDDNRRYFSENELRLFETSWLVDPHTGRPSLDRLTVYAVQSLMPWDGLTGGVSGRFKLGIEAQPAVRKSDKKALLIEGAIGRTWRITDDADAYVLVGGGWGWRNRGHLYGQPELGLILRQVWNMKSRLSRQVVTHPRGEDRPSHVWSWTQSMYAPGGHTWELRWQRVRQKQEQAHEVALAYKRLF